MSREKGWNLMQQLPTELLYGIIKFLRVKSYLRLKRTCRRMDGLSGWRIAFDARDLFLAMDHAKVDIALQLLKMCDESDAAFQTMMPWAARLGHLDIVKHCLDDARVDPGAFDQYAVRIASEMGNDKMVRLLIENPRTDPSAEDDFCLYMATNGLHWETVKILLNDARVNPDVCDNYCLKMASEHGQIDIVRLLLKDERVDPSAQESYAVLAAYEHGHESIVQLLVQDRRVESEAIEHRRQEDRNTRFIVYLLIAQTVLGILLAVLPFFIGAGAWKSTRQSCGPLGSRVARACSL